MFLYFLKIMSPKGKVGNSQSDLFSHIRQPIFHGIVQSFLILDNTGNVTSRETTSQRYRTSFGSSNKNAL